MAGTASPDDDVNDEATLSNGGAYWRSNYAGVWQMILYSDSSPDGPGIPIGDVDCEFGPRTAGFTRQFQRDQGIPESGKLDWATRDRADNPIWIDDTVNPGDGSDYAWRPGFWAYMYIHRLGPFLSPAYRWDVRNIFNANDWHGAACRHAITMPTPK